MLYLHPQPQEERRGDTSLSSPPAEGCNQFDRMKNRSDHTPLLAGKESNISIILRKPLPRKPLHHYTILIGTVKGKTLGNLHKSLYSQYLWPVYFIDISLYIAIT